jgi:hypothetical protein
MVNKQVEMDGDTPADVPVQTFTLVAPNNDMPLPFDFRQKGAETRVC